MTTPQEADLKLTREALIALDPCDVDQRLKLFGRRKSMNVAQAMKAGASVADILWVAERIGRKDLCIRFALACAQRVAYLNPDPRVQAALDATAAWMDDPTSQRAAARAAAGEAARDAAREAARDAAWAARDAAGAAAWAARAAAAAWAAREAAGAAAWAARDAAGAAAWAARAAAGAAAGDAAGAAAWAARDAAWAARDAAAAAGDARVAAGDAEREVQRLICLKVFA